MNRQGDSSMMQWAVIDGALLPATPRERTLMETERKLAALHVRRQCNQHACTTTPCDHPDHRRDVDDLRECLEAIGLPGTYPDVTPDEREAWRQRNGQVRH